jgi:hypothetical protein
VQAVSPKVSPKAKIGTSVAAQNGRPIPELLWGVRVMLSTLAYFDFAGAFKSLGIKLMVGFLHVNDTGQLGIRKTARFTGRVGGNSPVSTQAV